MKNRFFTHKARFAQGMQNVILHIYFIIMEENSLDMSKKPQF